MHVLTVVGARPQFIKAAPVCSALRDAGIRETLVHTGQHYDDAMSEVFFREMAIPAPAYNLGVGSGPHGAQTAAMLSGIEALLLDERPNWVLVYGDTNSTLAGALAASKLGVPIAHVEAGLRSFNRAMPEETNRVLTDHCADLLFCPSRTAVRNLAREGIEQGVHLVGDTMYDAVVQFAPVAAAHSTLIARLGLAGTPYCVATVHRPYNADDGGPLAAIVEAFGRLGRPVVFPVHPRTRGRIEALGRALPANVIAIEPVGYLDMLALLARAELVLTDSGGLQKEACFAGVPCVTLRPETEWVETVEAGWNRLAWGSAEAIVAAARRQLGARPGPIDSFGDGRAAPRIAAIMAAGQPHRH